MSAEYEEELTDEQRHLSESRANLARMRRRVEALDGGQAGNWVSAEVIEANLALRLEQLADDPDVPLFFGRIDREAETSDSDRLLHIGRRHISDPAGNPLVIDWRAPVSVPFYRATRSDPMGVQRRRRYGFHRGALTGFEDEQLRGDDAPPDVAPSLSTMVEAEIERPRVGPMRDIVATIQPEQDEIVRSDYRRTIVVQGAPGTGKTAVGLHRAAYLLHAHREQLTRRGVLVVGPNASFLRYIRDVLPALGEVAAKQTTLSDLVSERWPVRSEDAVDAAVVKGDARMAAVLRRAVHSHVSEPADALVVTRGARRWTLSASEISEVLSSVRSSDLRYEASRAMLPHALVRRVLLKMERSGEWLDDRGLDALARTKPVKACAAAIWPVVDPAKLLTRLLSDPEQLARAADGILTDDEQSSLLWPEPPRSQRAVRWSLADAVLLDELADLMVRAPSMAHIVVDEAQDLSAMMLRVLGRRAVAGSVTALGDLAQATTPWAVRSWPEALAHLGKPDGHVEQLTRGFRVPADVIEFAARLLPEIAPELTPPEAGRRSRGDLTFTQSSLADAVASAVARAGSVGLIVPASHLERTRAALAADGFVFAVVGEESREDGAGTEFDVHLDLVPATLAKGLEFDHVVVDDPAGIIADEADRLTGLRRLYVCLTRAVSSLTVRHHGDLPEELGDVVGV